MNLCKSNGNCIYVDQGETKVSTDALYTNHVGSCSVLLFHFDNKNFMAHIDGLQSHKSIEEILNQHFSKQKLQEKDFKIYLIVGPWCNNNNNICNSIKIANKVISNLGLQQKFVVLNKEQSKINWESEVWIDENGYSVIDTQEPVIENFCSVRGC